MNRATHRAQRREQQRQRMAPNATTWAKVIQGSQVIEQPLADTVMLRVHAAFDELRSGRAGGETAWELMHILASSINSALVRAEAIDPLIEPPLNAAVDAMQRADDRHTTHGRYGFDGPGLSAIATALDIYEEILRNSSEKQMVDAEAESHRRALQQIREQQEEQLRAA